MRLNNVIKGPPKRFIGGAFVIFLITFVIYIPAMRGDFIWDDDTFLYNNNLIKADDGLYSFWFSTKPPDYFPLTSTTLWLEWRLWGMNPLGYHVFNVLLHIVNSILIWLVLKRLKIPGAWLAALIFAIHPVNVESVAWITQRKNTLSMIFYVLSILFYLKFEADQRRYLYGLSLGAFLMALLSKTSVVMLPFVLLMCAGWQRGRIARVDLVRSVPYFAVAGILSLVTIWFQNQNIAGDVVRTDGFLSRLAGAGWAVWYYLYKAILPTNLSFVYPRWKIDESAIISYVPGIILMGLLITFWRYRKNWGKPLLFGLGYFVITLFPVVGFFNIYFMRYSLVADHWQYQSIIGIVALLVGIGSYAYHYRPELLRRPITVAVVIVIGVLALLSWKQGHIYKDKEVLYLDTIAKNPQCWMAHNNLGTALAKKGQNEKAIEHFSEALRIKPDHVGAHYNLASALEEEGRIDEAIRHYLEALKIKPDYVDAHNNLGIILEKKGRVDEAIDHYLKALHINPDFNEAHNNLGIAFILKGNIKGGIYHFREALRLNPDDIDAKNNLQKALLISQQNQ